MRSDEKPVTFHWALHKRIVISVEVRGLTKHQPTHRTGVLCIILCFALGIANIFHLHLVILFSILCLFVYPPLSMPPPFH